MILQRRSPLFAGRLEATMTLNPYISFGGECETAFRFYEQCLGGTIVTMLTWGGSPMATEVSPEWREKIAHATLTVGAAVLAGADVTPDKYQRPAGFQVLLGIDDVGEAERIFQALSENGTVHMAMAKTFWAERFGVVTDRFGVPWSINCERPRS